jgi:hypothetical protein
MRNRASHDVIERIRARHLVDPGRFPIRTPLIPIIYLLPFPRYGGLKHDRKRFRPLYCKVNYGLPCTVWSVVVDHVASPVTMITNPRTLLYRNGQWAGLGSQSTMVDSTAVLSFRGAWPVYGDRNCAAVIQTRTASPDDDDIAFLA